MNCILKRALVNILRLISFLRLKENGSNKRAGQSVFYSTLAAAFMGTNKPSGKCRAERTVPPET